MIGREPVGGEHHRLGGEGDDVGRRLERLDQSQEEMESELPHRLRPRLDGDR